MKVILFKGSNCVPCTQFEPVFDDLVAKFPTLFTTVELSTSKEVDNIDLMRQYGIRSVPSLAIVTDEGYKVIVGKDLRTPYILGQMYTIAETGFAE